MTTRGERESAVFVTRQAAAERLMVSVDTFDTWVRSGFIPRAHIDRGQIVRWHWPSIERALATTEEATQLSPFMEALKNAPKGRNRASA